MAILRLYSRSLIIDAFTCLIASITFLLSHDELSRPFFLIGTRTVVERN